MSWPVPLSDRGSGHRRDGAARQEAGGRSVTRKPERWDMSVSDAGDIQVYIAKEVRRVHVRTSRMEDVHAADAGDGCSG